MYGCGSGMGKPNNITNMYIQSDYRGEMLVADQHTWHLLSEYNGFRAGVRDILGHGIWEMGSKR